MLTAFLIRASLFPTAVHTEAPPIKLPVIMYHSILKDPSRAGSYVVSPETLENDLKFLKERGYSSILPRELYEAVTKGDALPPKPIMITFDDGFLNNLTYALPLLEKYGMKAVVSVVGCYSECFSLRPDPNPAYAHLSWDDITELTSTDRIEIGNHSYDMHKKEHRKGTRKMSGESDAEYYAALVCDIGATQSLLEENCGILPTTFAYPYGSISEQSIPILQEMGFTVLLTCTEKVNSVIYQPEQPLILGRFNRPSGISTERFMKKLGIT